MRKILGAIALLLLTSCSGNGGSEKEQENYSQATDSIVETVVEDENLGTAENQAALEDSIMNVQIEEEYRNGLSLKKQMLNKDKQLTENHLGLITHLIS